MDEHDLTAWAEAVDTYLAALDDALRLRTSSMLYDVPAPPRLSDFTQ